MTSKQKIYLVSVLSWMVSVKLFFVMSFYGQLWSIWEYSGGVGDFYVQTWNFFLQFLGGVGVGTLLLSGVFLCLLAYFYYTYFWVSYNKLDQNIKLKNSKHAVVGSVFTFLGFGCVACGQTLLYSFLLLLGSTVSTFLAPVIGQISLIIGILFLSFGIYKNLQLKNSPNICKI
jgi:hypothetical protein